MIYSHISVKYGRKILNHELKSCSMTVVKRETVETPYGQTIRISATRRREDIKGDIKTF